MGRTPDREKLETHFEKLYRALNPEQREAVDEIEGPVMVIAGPGTGKTSILTLRIANILRKTDASVSSILALTFTESGVHSIRKKLVEIVGPTGYRANIHTFHSFCNEIIKRYPQEFPRIIGAQNMSDLDQIKILEEIISKTKLKNLKPYGNPFFYLKSIISQIKELKRDDIDPKNFKKILADERKRFESNEDLYHQSGAYKGEMKAKWKPTERRIQNSEELFLVYEKYQESLDKKRLYDYEDMIIEVLKELRANKNLLLELQENYQYILADEHQDANNAQNKLLELLSGFHKNPNLFIVGDEKQAIFRFQGASLENFLYFKKRFKEAKLITLKKNYRSPQAILDASHSLISKNILALDDMRPRLVSSRSTAGPSIFLAELPSQRLEYEWVVSKIKMKIAGGVDAPSIAVLYRDNKDALPLRQVFESAGVPYVIHSETDLFADEDIRAFIAVLYAINDFGNDELIVPVLFFDFLGLDHLDVFKLVRASRKNKISIYDSLRKPSDLKAAGIKDVNKFSDLYSKLHKLSLAAKKKNLSETLEAVMHNMGFISYLMLGESGTEKLSLLNTLLSQAVGLLERHKYYTLKDYIIFLNTLSRHDVSIRTQGFSVAPGKVNLMTAHKSKGLEFDYVFCVGMNDGHWGNRRMPSYFLPLSSLSEVDDGGVEDERRLLYVALTRARKEVTLSYSKKDNSQKELLPSQFLEEIDPSKIKKIDIKVPIGKAGRVTSDRRPKVTPSIRDKNYLRKVFLEEGISVSALNNYIDCPWKFFFLNLIRVPKAEERYQLYGTAIHETLKVFFDEYRNGRLMSKKNFLSLFENFLNKKALSEDDFKLFLEKGTKSLSGYFEAYKNTWPKPIVNELNVVGTFLPFTSQAGSKESLLLKGKIDKIEPDLGDSVTVVDYKTGNPKSRREIEGGTKSSDGNYKRQLVFYKILLDEFDSGQLKVGKGVVDFVEPDKSGKYRKELFEITVEDADALRKEISSIAAEIFDLKFWNKKCDDSSCEFCRLRETIVGQ